MIYHIKNKGFTLIEMLVAVAIFSGISLLLVNIFIALVSNENRILQNQKLLDEATYSLEYMSKAITMAQMDDDAGTCTGTPDANFGIATNSITFLAHDTTTGTYKCRRFFLDGNAIQEEWSSDKSYGNLESETPITSTKVKVDKLTFGVTGDATGYQPKVTILVNLEYNSSASNNPKISVQTSISERNLNITQ
jgi:prepilin-type N-terminal cleavage/methylation domain-containing protein